MILIFPSVYVSRTRLFSKNPLVRSLYYASRQPNEFLCFIVIFYYCHFYFIIFFFHDKRLPIDNVYFNKYDAPLNREPFEAPPLLILPLFRSGKVGQLFSQA